MHNPANLIVLDRAFALAVAVHKSPIRRSGRSAPGLSNQLLRSVSSIGANITEGAACDSAKGFAQFLQIAIGSANETELHLRMACALGLLSKEGQAFVSEVVEIRRMLIALRRRVLNEQ